MSDAIRRHLAKIATCAIAAVLYGFAAPRNISAEERSALGASLRFSATYLDPGDNGLPSKNVRKVHPALQRIDAWISSVGAGVALADIEGTGLPADICLVDPRNDSVSVMPAPDTGERYARFALTTPAKGYDPRTIAPMGCLPADFNEDGRMDLLVYYWGRTPVIFLRNDTALLSAAAFTPIEITPEREVWNTNAAMFADIDGDGHPDLMFGNYFRDGERVLDDGSTTEFQMQHSMSRAGNGGRNRLLLWQNAAAHTVAYRDASDAFTPDMANGWTLALAARDLDNDFVRNGGEALAPFLHLPEIYIANDFGPDRLLVNRSTRGHPRFELAEGHRDLTTPRSKVIGQDSFKGMGVDFGDITGDEHPAIAVSNISSEYALLESHFLFVYNGQSAAWGRNEAPYRDEGFKRGTWTSNWAWDIKFADLLNSGHPALVQAIGFIKGGRNRWPELQELALSNDELVSQARLWPRFTVGDDLSGHDHDRIFLQDASGHFHDVWPQLGLDQETVSRGIAMADVFGDGRLALVIARQWSQSLFLRNISADAGRAIVLDLRVPGAVAGTRAAVGAEATLRLADGRKATAVVDGGSGHSGKRAQEIHLGLGHAPDNELFKVTVTWRDGNGVHSQVVEVTPGRHTVVLGETECRPPRETAILKGMCRVIDHSQS
ncbi:CRTAC1 family protein [Bradyrhizobium sp. SZCCHNRI1029]|uniref:CRTAC1 family protein n=1 Tax=Bradyrhizobium sp. SZCCHNRI1029 TaxID=3057278 RepID=UPI00291613A0|nr:CRTAC1 family protein [Bradyrhizobium sp. SZCCHNRI1029]